MKKYIYQGKDKISIVRECKTCEWAFGQYNKRDRSYSKKNIDYYICAGHSDVVEYGTEIKDLHMTCDCWEIGFDYFISLVNRLEKKNNPYLVARVEELVGFGSGLIKRIGKDRKPVFFIDAKLRGWELEHTLEKEVKEKIKAVKSGNKKEVDRIMERIVECMFINKVKRLAVKVDKRAYTLEMKDLKKGKNLAIGFTEGDFKGLVKV